MRAAILDTVELTKSDETSRLTSVSLRIMKISRPRSKLLPPKRKKSDSSVIEPGSRSSRFPMIVLTRIDVCDMDAAFCSRTIVSIAAKS